MARFVLQAARARGSLSVNPKADEAASAALPERFCAWDEDRTTLAVEAARAVPRAPLAFVGPGIDLETLRVALDVPTLHLASDPMAMAKAASGPALAIGCPDDQTAIAALVAEGAGPDVASPRDVSAPPTFVSPLRALQEARRVAPPEPVPDSPMGAYVPWGTWVEDLPARLRLVAQRCEGCAKLLYPPRGACPACRGRAFAPVELPSQAEVYALTRIGRGGAPSEFALEQAHVGAYLVAVVAWPVEGVRVSARLAGFGDEVPAIRTRVRPVVRRLFEQEGRVRYGVKFAPA